MLNKSIKYFVAIAIVLSLNVQVTKPAQATETDPTKVLSLVETDKLLQLPKGVMNLILSQTLNSYTDIKKLCGISRSWNDRLSQANMPILIKFLADNNNGKTLQIASAAGDIKIAEECWQNIFNLATKEFEKLDDEAKKEFALQILKIAVKFNRINVLDFIYQIYLKKQDKDCIYSQFHEILDSAIKYNNFEVVEYFNAKVPAYVDVVRLGYRAIENNNFEFLKKMHHHQILFDDDDQFVGVAVEQNNYEMTKFLIDTGRKLIETDSHDTDGLITLTIENNNLNLLSLLAEQVVKDDFEFARSAKDMLNNAKKSSIKKDNIEAFKILLSFDSDLSSKHFSEGCRLDFLRFINDVQNDFNQALSVLPIPLRNLIIQYFGQNSFLNYKINLVNGRLPYFKAARRKG